MTTFQKFLKKNINLTPIGVERGENNNAYFCTPMGARIFGWTGVDGIHFCFIRGFGEMVFAISPMNTSGEYVHPLARNFSDFLRLLLACGDSAALEQAWMWDQKQFEDFLRDNPVTEDQQAVLDSIREQMNLAPMEDPFAYIKTLQTEFDGSQIKYTEDFEDPDMNPKARPAIPEWKVYFDGGFWGHHGRDHAGIEIPIDRQFQWADRQWIVPAVYSCSKGLVVDFCMRIDPDEIRTFMDKWHLDIENDAHHHFSDEEIMEIERDNPLCFNFSPQIVLNGTTYHTSHGSGVSYNPCLPEDVVNEMEDAQWAIHHYGLDDSFGWMVWRAAFPWKGKRRREINSLSVIMEQQPVAIPGPHFTVTNPGDRFQFAHPTTGQLHTIIMHECEQKELPQSVFQQPDMEFPMHYTAMSYTITPDLPDGAITIRDCADSDQPRRKEVNPMEPEASHCTAVSIIGGSDGPTAIIFCNSEERKQHVVCSSPHFEPTDKIEWRLIFHEKQFDKLLVDLTSQE